MRRFWKFDQNNSGGSFDIDDACGIGPNVWVEAESLAGAVSRALEIGIYFNGCDDGRDCECCGDRWSEPWRDEGEEVCLLSLAYDFSWWNTVYLHRLDGSIERITSEEAGNLQPHLRLAA